MVNVYRFLDRVDAVASLGYPHKDCPVPVHPDHVDEVKRWVEAQAPLVLWYSLGLQGQWLCRAADPPPAPEAITCVPVLTDMLVATRPSLALTVRISLTTGVTTPMVVARHGAARMYRRGWAWRRSAMSWWTLDASHRLAHLWVSNRNVPLRYA